MANSVPPPLDGINAEYTAYSSPGAHRWYKLTSNGSVEDTQAMAEGMYRVRFDSGSTLVGWVNIGAAVGSADAADNGFHVHVNQDCFVKIQAGGETLHFLGTGDLYCTRIR